MSADRSTPRETARETSREPRRKPVEAPRVDAVLAIAADRIVVVGDGLIDRRDTAGGTRWQVRSGDEVCDAIVHHRRVGGTGSRADIAVIEHRLRAAGAGAVLQPGSGRGPTIDIAPTTDDVSDVLRHGLAAANANDRADVLALLVASCAAGRTELTPRLARHLHLCREALRTRLPFGIIDRRAPRSAMIETVAAVDRNAIYLRGWIGHATRDLTSVVAVGPEGERIELFATMVRSPRPDVAALYAEDDDDDGYGFAAYFETAVPSAVGPGWLLEVVPGDAPAFEAEATTDPVSSIDQVRALLVGDIAIERRGTDDVRRGTLAPAITQLLDRAQRRVRIRHVEQLGDPPRDAEVSIIVPLYQRIDFVEHQLVQFVDDPELRDVDLVYVLDSPELADGLVAEAHRWHRFFGLPFRVVVSSHNGGFSSANNLGASVARGRLLLLMNSDVIPDRPGWLSRLVDCHDSTPNVGAVGPKLVYEDESIQHAGMYFDRPIGSNEWQNEHYFKGLHRSLPAACVSREVPAVSAACMLIDAQRYREINGLRGIYVQGDYEDSDMCLRLAAEGRVNWYCADVELYHLEGQSYPTPARVQNGKYNRWLHTHLWGREIEAVMAVHRDGLTMGRT